MKLWTQVLILAAIGLFFFGWYNFAPTGGDNTLLNNENNMVNSEAIIKTNLGNITLRLYTSNSPVTAGNFIKLANEGFYDGAKFHRVIDGFMIQGGDPNSKGDDINTYGTGGPGYKIEDEFIEGNSNLRGTISMANSGPNTGGSQFFINLVDNTNLDFDKEPLSSKHPVFGEVINGMDIVDKIGAVETGNGDIPVVPVVIETVIIIDHNENTQSLGGRGDI